MYEIFLDDKINNQFAKLDTDTIDLTTVFAVSDINNISTRKETYTKNVTFQGSENNNKAFGFAYMLNKDITINDMDSGHLFENFNPQILVDCFVYENGVLLFKGSMRLLKVTVNPNGTYSYTTIITGDLVTFNDFLSDKTLSDLDLSEMTHTYNFASIQNNWSIDPKSVGYVYPLMHNGYKFNSAASVAPTIPNPFNLLNYKPAVFVTKILDKIFKNSAQQTVDDVETTVGIPFSWKIEGSEELKEQFSNLIIPNNQEYITNKFTFDGENTLLKANLQAWQTVEKSYFPGQDYQTTVYQTRLNDIPVNKVDNLTLLKFAGTFGGSDYAPYWKNNVVLNVEKTFKSSGFFNYTLVHQNKFGTDKPLVGKMVLLERPVVSESSNSFKTWAGWDVVAIDTFQYEPTGGVDRTRNETVQIPEREFKIGTQFRFCFVLETGANFSIEDQNNFIYTVTNLELNLPNQVGGSIVTTIGNGDSITPTLPTGIKQIDFISSLRNLFNFYVYLDTDTRTVIFKQYDEYYSNSKGLQLANTALDWSYKIDRTAKIEISSNVDIVKKYNFTWKNDSDYVNDYYQKKYNKSYGDLTLSDVTGIAEKKDVSVIFSPTPLVLSAPNIFGQGGFTIPMPWIYKLDGNDTSPLASNIRILYYNGIRTVSNFTIINEKFKSQSANYSIDRTSSTTTAIASNFIMDADGNYVQDIHFGEPDEIFFMKEYSSIPSSYSSYNNQIQELRNPNVTYVECEAYLNENDINQLDLSIPIFLDFGINGHSYWKLLEVNYVGNARTSSIKLQKIIL